MSYSIMTERQMVLREREAFVRGAGWRLGIWQRALRVDHTQGEDEIAASRQHYPLPKVTQPRVVRDPEQSEYFWSVRDGALCFRWLKADADDWKRASGMYENLLLTPVPSRVAMWADLLASPTEEVEA